MEKQIQVLDEDSVETLKGCFDCTSWSVFEDSSVNLDEMTEVISNYIDLCVGAVIPTKTSRAAHNKLGGKILDPCPDEKVCLSSANKLNEFFTHFDNSPALQERDYWDNTHNIDRESTDTQKSPGPDNIGGRVLKHCSAQLSEIFCSLLQRSLDIHVVLSL